MIEKYGHAHFLWRAKSQFFEFSIFDYRYSYWAWFWHKMTQGIDSRSLFRSKMFMWPDNPATPWLLRHAKSQIFEFSILVSRYNGLAWFWHKMTLGIDSGCLLCSQMFRLLNTLATPTSNALRKSQIFEFVINFFHCSGP